MLLPLLEQVPLTHVWPPEQATPKPWEVHPPQLPMSVCGSMQLPPQQTLPAAEQFWPCPVAAQPPQLVLSVWGLTQLSPQGTWPAGHWQIPAVTLTGLLSH